MYRNRIKRVIAIIMSLCGIICLSWLYIILIIAIKIDSPGPVFFKQKRVGIHKKTFSNFEVPNNEDRYTSRYANTYVRESGSVYHESRTFSSENVTG